MVTQPVAGRRPGRARRAVAAVPWSRLVAATALVAVSGALYLATSDRMFAVDARTVPITGATITGHDVVRDALRLPDDRLVNIFRIPTTELEARVEDLPAVLDATVTATLPDLVAVSVVERSPMLVWRTGRDAWLVDGSGFLFAPASALDPRRVGSGATGTNLPAVDDRRTDAPATLGSTIPALDLEAVRLLLTITPSMVRSEAPDLFLALEDTDGYVLEAPGAWRAVFGPYTPVLRPPAIIPRQLQCLDALVGGREAQLVSITLSLSDEACGTFQTRPTPRETPRSGRRGGGDGTPRP
jgi:cell division septal protein FtsQ